MAEHDDLRPGEQATDAPLSEDATVQFIGLVRTPFSTRAQCPRQGDLDGPECRLELEPQWHPALKGLEDYQMLDVLYWLDRSRRDLVLQSPRSDGRVTGTFSLRSPVRPNPIGLSKVRLVRVTPGVVHVRGLDCLDGTPLLDIKPSRCEFTPKAPHKPPAG